MISADFPHESRLEGLRFATEVLLPNVVEGLFRRRPKMVSLAARIGLDARLVRLLSQLKQRYADGPIWIRVGKNDALVVAVEAIQRWPDTTKIARDRKRIQARRGRNIAKVAAARKLLTLVYYGLRDGHIRAVAHRQVAA